MFDVLVVFKRVARLYVALKVIVDAREPLVLTLYSPSPFFLRPSIQRNLNEIGGRLVSSHIISRHLSRLSDSALRPHEHIILNFRYSTCVSSIIFYIYMNYSRS